MATEGGIGYSQRDTAANNPLPLIQNKCSHFLDRNQSHDLNENPREVGKRCFPVGP